MSDDARPVNASTLLDECIRLRARNAELLAALEAIDITLSTRRKGKAMEALSLARAAQEEQG